MRQPFVEPDVHRNAIRMPRRQRQPQILIPPLARSQQHHRGAQPWKLVGNVSEEIESFLIDHPRDQADNRARQRSSARRQPVALEQLPLGRLLPVEIIGVIRPGNVRIALRIPLIVVDPVQDPDQIRAALAQDPVEAEPELRGLNLLRVARDSQS